MRRNKSAGYRRRGGIAGIADGIAGIAGGIAGITAGRAAAAVLFAAATLLTAAAFLLTGCGRSPLAAERSEIYIDGDGGLYTVLYGVYDAAKDYYREEELAARAEDEAAAYNAEHSAGVRRPEEMVSVEKVRLGDGTASVVLRYSDAEHLIRFTEASQDEENHTEMLSVTTVGEGLSGRVEEAEAWIDAKRNDPVTPEQIRRRADLHLVAVAGPVTLQTEKRILYYSGAVSLLDPYTAQVADGDAYLVYK